MTSDTQNQMQCMDELPSTPCVMINLDRVEININRMQSYCDKHGLLLRPHIKTHKIPALAKLQIEAGAQGITCQKISEAEAFADAGCDNILITYNILGEQKLQRLRALADKIQLCVVADNITVIEGLASAFKTSKNPLSVMVECDTGAGRCGVQTPEQALELAQSIQVEEKLHFVGLMTYPPTGASESTQSWLAAAKELLLQHQIPCDCISNGGTPDRAIAHLVPIATEYRIGTYIYCDRSLLATGRCTSDEIALHLHATVISRPTDTRAVIDAGSKALTSDLLGLEGHGLIEEYPEAVIRSLSEEHAVIDLSACTQKPAVGERLRIVPNHACPVSNLFNQVWFYRGDQRPTAVDVAARGCVV